MQNFILYNPTKIYFGQGQIASLNTALGQHHNILITYGQGSIKRNGVYDQVIANLKPRNYIDFAGVEPNPTYETLMQAVEIARQNKIDFILAVGGGSVLDGTKFISAAINFQGDPWQILASKNSDANNQSLIKNAVPFGSVLTLPATGSEMNCGAVISRKETGDKLAFTDPAVFPQFSILDPTTTYGLPTKQTCNGIVDAFVHVIEQYITYPVNSPIQDRLAEGILLTLIEEAPKVLSNPHDYDTRANIMWAATLALNGYLAAGVPQDWATHIIGHTLTAKYGIDHGETLAIILPSVLRVAKSQKQAKLLQYASRIWQINDGDEDSRIEKAISKTEEFFRSLQMKTKLTEHGIGKEVIDIVTQKLQQHGYAHLGEKGYITLEKSAEIVQRSL